MVLPNSKAVPELISCRPCPRGPQAGQVGSAVLGEVPAGCSEPPAEVHNKQESSVAPT